jgi:hypothetical protein
MLVVDLLYSVTMSFSIVDQFSESPRFQSRSGSEHIANFSIRRRTKSGAVFPVSNQYFLRDPKSAPQKFERGLKSNQKLAGADSWTPLLCPYNPRYVYFN